jgi:brefeldin A-inhibited guanine nucleotide-exchange protein
MYAIDSLKQLSIKFLSKGEMTHFQGQKEFLSPFETIYNGVASN